MNERYFYIWRNHIGRTCFGIANNAEQRKRKYEGHNGFEVNWLRLYKGPAAHIEDLEYNVKLEFTEHLFCTFGGKYEWVNQDIATDQVIGWIEYEIANKYNKIIQPVEIVNSLSKP